MLLLSYLFFIFTTRRDTTAVFCRRRYVSIRLSVCLSVTSRYCIETTGRVELGFGTQTSHGLSSKARDVVYKRLAKNTETATIHSTTGYFNVRSASWSNPA